MGSNLFQNILHDGDVKIADLVDLNIVEIVTLQALLAHSKPTVRHVLYLEVNQTLFKEKKISASSFYNSLKSLEKKELLISNRNQEGKVVSIEATTLAKKAIFLISQFFTANIFNLFEFELQFMQEIQKKMQATKQQVESVLFIDTVDYVDLKLMQHFTKIASDLYILTTNETFEEIKKTEIKQINHTIVNKGLIREPNDVFDLIIIPTYVNQPKLYNLTMVELLKEAARVTKKGGCIITTSVAEFPTTDHYLANQALETYIHLLKDTFITKESLEKDFENIKTNKIDIFNFYGMLIGICWLADN